MSINSCRSLATHLHTPALIERLCCRLETNSSRLAPLTYACLKFLATVIFPLPLFHQLINSNDVPNCRRRRQPHHHLKPNGYLTYQMTHRKVLCAQQVRVSVREHIRWLHACDAGRGRAAASINSALSSSAVVQTWINGAINLSFQMYYFSTSIPFPAGHWCPPPLKSVLHAYCPRWPAHRGELCAILSILDSDFCGVQQYQRAATTAPHHTTEMSVDLLVLNLGCCVTRFYIMLRSATFLTVCQYCRTRRS